MVKPVSFIAVQAPLSSKNRLLLRYLHLSYSANVITFTSVNHIFMFCLTSKADREYLSHNLREIAFLLSEIAEFLVYCRKMAILRYPTRLNLGRKVYISHVVYS